MGMFDSIYFKCECGAKIEAQSKSGECCLEVFDYENVPFDVAIDANSHAPFICHRCDSKYEFEQSDIPKFVKLKLRKL